MSTHQACFLFEQVGVELEMGGSTKADSQNQIMLPKYLVPPPNQALLLS